MEQLETGKIINTQYERFAEDEDQAPVTLDLRTDWAGWQAELKRLRKLKIEITAPGKDMTCSLYRKKHPNSPLGFWYAQKRIKKKLNEKYLGADSNLTVEKISEVVRDFYQMRIDTSHS